MDTEKGRIKKALGKGVSVIYPDSKSLESALKKGKKLRIYTGIDPTGKLHIGHMVVLRKLRQFQDLGHEIIILIGDFTAQIGDPTDKLAARKKLTLDEIGNNAKHYKQLIGKILDIKRSNLRFLHNQEWSNKLKPADMLELASNFTVQQLIERDMFQERLKSNKEIHLNEFLYPIFQAYDAVTMDVDMQIGGNDQIFNMLAGRTLMRKLMNKEKFVLATKLLTDGSGKKMGKTEGNVISLDDAPNDIFGKIMAFPDTMILIGLELLTDKDSGEIERIEKKLGKEINPRDAKSNLAFDVVKQLYSESEAKKARDNFINQFQKKEMPDEMISVKLSGNYQLTLLLIEIGAARSNSDAKRLIEQGGVKIDKAKITDVNAQISTHKGMIIQVGKRKFWRVK